MPFALKGDELRAATAKLRSYLAIGKPEEEIATEMAISWNDYLDLKRQLYKFESERLQGRTTEEVYTDYVLAQERNIHDLTKIIEQETIEEDADGIPQKVYKVPTTSVTVGAIKARSEIYDKLIAKGQEFGFIAKKPVETQVSGTVLHRLALPDLRRTIMDELKALDSMSRKLGFEKSILDLDPGAIHHDAIIDVHATSATPERRALPPPRQKVQTQKSKPHARTPVHGGRGKKRYKATEL